MRTVVSHLVQQGIHRVGDHLALCSPSHSVVGVWPSAVFGLQPVYDAAGDKGAGAVALQQGDQLVYQRIEQLLMAIVAGQPSSIMALVCVRSTLSIALCTARRSRR